MSLKTVRALRVPEDCIPTMEQIHKVGCQYEARECQHQEEKHWGFKRFEHKADSHEAFVTPLHNGRWLHLLIGMHKRLLPGAVVKQKTKERAQQLGKARGEELSKKEVRELKEEVRVELLAKSHQKETVHNVIFDLKEHQLWIDATSDALETDIMRLIRRGFGSMPVTPALTDSGLPTLFAAWIAGNADMPGNIRIGDKAKAIDPDEPKATITLTHEELMSPDIQKVLETRMLKQLGLASDYVQVVMTDTATLKSVKVVVDTQDAEADPDHMMTLWCMEMRGFLDDLESELAPDPDVAEPTSQDSAPSPEIEETTQE